MHLVVEGVVVKPDDMTEMKRLFEECRDRSYNLRKLREIFDGFQEEHYGFIYNDRDMDDIIDAIDMGGGNITFDRFHKRMLEEAGKGD